MEKKQKNISSKQENVVKGLFASLLSLICIINVGYLARTLAFPLVYFFGTGNLLILGVCLFFSLYRFIFGKKLKIKSILVKIGLICLIVSILFLIGYGWAKNNAYQFGNGTDAYILNLNASLGKYYSYKFIDFFAVNNVYSNGVILMSLLSYIPNQEAGLYIGIALLVVFAIFICIPVASIISKKNEVKEAQKRALENQMKEEKIESVPIPDHLPPEPEPVVEREPEIVFEKEPCEVKFGFEPEPETEANFIDTISRIEINDKTAQGINSVDCEFSRLEFNSESRIINDTQVNNIQPNQNINFDIESDVKVEEPVDETPLYEENKQIVADDELPNIEPSINEENLIEETATCCESQAQEEINHPFEETNTCVAQNKPEPIVQKPQIFESAPEPIKPVKRERVNWIPPSTELLSTYEIGQAVEANTELANKRVEIINQVFTDFGIGASCIGFTIGPSVTRFNIEYLPNVSSKNVEKIVDDISRRLGGIVARFTRIVEGTPYSGLEVPNGQTTTVGFKDIFEKLPDVNKHPMAVGFGKNIAGEVVYADFNEFPHLLVAGTTGSGKSIYIHSIISTLIMRVSPDDLKIALVDPKCVEMTKYRDMPHLLCPIISEAVEAKNMLAKLVEEMNDRYHRFVDADDASDIRQFNEWAKEHNQETMPYILVVLDEYADLVETCKEISAPVVSIAQKARASGIHMLISTQRPSTNVITGVIKGNLPTHVALMTSSFTDSNVIIGENGAEKLMGKGDMLVQSPLISRTGVTRLQGCFVQNKEIGRIVGYLKEHYETIYDPNYSDLADKKEVLKGQSVSEFNGENAGGDEEAKYQSIKDWVMSQEFVSMSKIQRECSVGFNRAGRFFIRLQDEGIVSSETDSSNKGCKVLVHDKFSSSGDDYNVNDYIG